MKSTTLLSYLLTTTVYACPTTPNRAKISDLPIIVEPKKSNGTSSSTIGAKGATNTTAAAAVLPDGRIEQAVVATDFNVLASVFKSAVVKGDGKTTETYKFSITHNSPQVFSSATLSSSPPLLNHWYAHRSTHLT